MKNQVWKRLKFIVNIRKSLPFLLAFFRSKEVPLKKKFLSIGLVAAYFVFPFDIIPDFLIVFGIVDDVGILMLVLQGIVKMAPPSLREKYKL